MLCPVCGTAGAYIGLRIVECRNRKCRNFKRPPSLGLDARVHWDINGKRGNSRVLDMVDAEIRAEEGNEKFGEGTHWVELEDAETSWIYDMY